MTTSRHTQAVENEQLSQVRRIPRIRIRRFTDQPRTYFDETEMADLKASIEEIGQQTPIVVKVVTGDPLNDYELVDGERRLIACGLAGVETMLAWVRPIEDDEEQFLASVVANFGRSGHTRLESAHAVDRVMKFKRMQGLSRMEQVTRIAKIFAHAVPWVYERFAILRLHPDVQAMMEPTIPEEERLGQSLAVFISSLHHDLQLEIAKVVVAKRMSVNRARLYARQVAEEAGVKIKTTERPSGLPSRSWERLSILTRVIQEGLDKLLIPGGEQALQKRDPAERAIMAGEIEQQIARLNRLLVVLIEPARERESIARGAGTASVGEQSLELSGRVLSTLFYSSGTMNPQVNLSRGALQRAVQNDDLGTLVKNAIAAAREHWRMPPGGTTEKQKFIRLVSRFRYDFGDPAKFDDALSRAIKEDRSGDPVPFE